MKTIAIKNIKNHVLETSQKARSAWGRGVAKYALELLANAEENGTTSIDIDDQRAALSTFLNGAKDWQQYSEGGCSLVGDFEIATRLCSRSEIAHYYHGNPNGKRPNATEATWLETQARALHQAFHLILRAAEVEHATTEEAA